MRIGLVLDRFDRRLGGVEQWTAQLADRLLSRGDELHVVARSVADRELRPGITPHVLPSLSSRLALADAAAVRLQSLDLDVIHDMGFGWYCDVLQPHGGSRLAANRQNLSLTWPFLRPFKQGVARILPRYREFAALSDRQYRLRGDGRPGRVVIAISEMVKADLKRYHGLDDSEIRLVYNGVDVDRFAPRQNSAERNRIRTELNVRQNEPLYLIVAHNFLLKGVPTLLRAMALLHSAGRGGQLAIVGGKRTKRFQAIVRRRGLQNAVHFIGSIDDPSPYYAAADVYVQPTWYDPCSLVLLEALASGLPVITSRFNGAGELIISGTHGDVLSDPGDAVTLAASMIRWADPMRIQAASSACRSLMMRHTLDHNVSAIVAVYEELVARRATRPRVAA